MADHNHHHHHHRPHRLTVPPRTTANSASFFTPRVNPSSAAYPHQYPSSSAAPTPTPTPSKHRLSSLSLPFKPSSSSKPSLSFPFLLLLSLRSFYSLLPSLRSSPSSFSLFPFSFLFSLLSFLLSLSFSFLLPSPSPFRLSSSSASNSLFFSLSSLSSSQLTLLLSRSLLLSLVFLLRFLSLRYCGASAFILADLSGNAAARFLSDRTARRNGIWKLPGFLLLFVGFLFLSLSWDRIDCFPFSTSYVGKFGFSVFPRDECFRIRLMLLPFLCGFLGCYERLSMNWGTLRQLGPRRVRLISLFYSTVLLFIPAAVNFFMIGADYNGDVSFGNLGWPLANTVVFGVLLSENYSDEKLASPKDFRREFVITFVCTIVLELFYFPELSLWGLLLCGLLLYFAVRELDPIYSSYMELGLESSEPFSTSIMKPIRHILSERKSRKIALFLLINTGYMVVEFVYGFMSNSLGLISDACHMLFDCAALAIGLYASYISRLPSNHQFNYGRGRFEVLSGYVNAVLLVLVGALIVLESFERILDPQEISTSSLLVVSIGGLVVNVVGLVFFHEEHHHAHGGSGSCSHSHSQSHLHSHSHSSHHHHLHDEEGHVKHHECLSLSEDFHKKSLTSHDNHHEHHKCSHHTVVNSCQIESSNCHDEHDHEHQNHGHHHHAHYDNHCHETHDDHCQHHHASGDALGSSLAIRPHAHHSSSDSQPIKSVSNEGKQQKSHHHHIDHNMEGIFLHVLADTMGSVGVVISTLLIKYKGWLVADPASSIFISILIISSVIPLLRNSAEILLQRVPRAHELDVKEAVKDIMKIKGVHGIQSLHVWSLTNTDIVGTLHLHVSAEADKASVRTRVSRIFHDAGIKDLTVQVECAK